MATYKIFYEGNFCDKNFNNVQVLLLKRVPDGFPEVDVKEVKFAGVDEEPVIIEYTEDGKQKDTPIITSQCTINLKAGIDFDLYSLYTEDEKEWKVIIQGAWKWTGFLIPDNYSEPYESGEYTITVQATDALGTLEDLPFQNADLTKIKGWYSDLDMLNMALSRTGLTLNVVLGCSTFEAQMNTAISPFKQSFIKGETFISGDQTSFSCQEVIRSIMARYYCRLMQRNGKWEAINVLEYSRGSVKAWEYDYTGALVGVTENIVVNKSVGDVTRDNRPTRAYSSLAKGYLSSTAYYQYGYISNSLINGNMDTWTNKPTGLPDGWVVVQGTGTVTATTGVRQVNGIDTTDYYITVEGAGSGRVQNNNPTQIRANDTAVFSMIVYAPSIQQEGFGSAYLSIVLIDDAGNYYTNNGWQNTYGTYTIAYKTGDTDWTSQISVSFNVNSQSADYKINSVGILPIGLAGGMHFATRINDVSINSGADTATKQAIGSFNKQTQLTAQTYAPEPIVILNSDDQSTQRNSPIRVNNLPTSAWKRKDITESVSLLHTIANSQLRTHSKPYKIFEGDFFGIGDINPVTLLNIDLNPGNFIFMSGTFNLKTNIHKLRFAQALIDEVIYVETQALDYGDKKNGNGLSVGTPQGVDNNTGTTTVDLTGYAKSTDIPAAASNVETQAGALANKYVSPSTLANWWSYIKTTVQTISGIWNFTSVVNVGSSEKISMAGAGAVSVLAFNRNAGTGAIFNTSNNAVQMLHAANGTLTAQVFNSSGALVSDSFIITPDGHLQAVLNPSSDNDVVRKIDLDNLNPKYREVSSNYTLLVTDNTVNVTANSPTLTLPTAVGIQGRIIRIKNSSTGTVTINTTGSQLIDGTLTKVINTQYSLFGLQSTGANWIIIAQM